MDKGGQERPAQVQGDLFPWSGDGWAATLQSMERRDSPEQRGFFPITQGLWWEGWMLSGKLFTVGFFPLNLD